MKNKYGYFSEDRKEFIITNPSTPRAWFNYLFNDKYHCICSATGGGFSYYIDPKSYRILKWEHLHTDRPGRYVFLRDMESNDFWSINWQPIRKELDKWETHHGINYTVIKSENKKIYGEITYFVPVDVPVECWIVKIKNLSNKKRKIKAFPFAHFLDGDPSMEAVLPQIYPMYLRAHYDYKKETIFIRRVAVPGIEKERHCFFTTTAKVNGFDCVKEKFFESFGYSDTPKIAKTGKCLNTNSYGEDTIGVFEHYFELNPGQEKEFAITLGFIADNTIANKIKQFKNLKWVKEKFVETKNYWNEYIEKFTVKTPDEKFDTMVNIWGKIQLTGITHFRGTSPYHGAEGGLGYRDLAQDIEGITSLDLKVAKEKLMLILKYQYNYGHTVSGFSLIDGPWSNEGVTGKADVPVWLPYTTLAYVKESGDIKFLKEKVPFLNGGSATVYEHILRAVRYLFNETGKNGLPLIKRADWNDAYDCLGKGGKGESVWLAMALCRALNYVKELAAFLKDKKVMKEMEQKHKIMKDRINKVAFDGDYYIAAFNDRGYKIGYKGNKEGIKPLNSQTWAILGDVIPNEERLNSVLKTIDDLDTPYGPVLFKKAYTEFNPEIGRVTSFAPGIKENAAVFSHAVAFKVVADCMIKRGEHAYESFSKLLPLSDIKLNDPDKYKVEPYVYAEYVVGPDNPENYGEGTFTWNTGTSPWMFMAATQWIFGVRADFDGIIIDPCLPEKWDEVFMKRPFRGKILNIRIKNLRGKASKDQKVTIYINDEKIEGIHLPMKKIKANKAKEVNVLVEVK